MSGIICFCYIGAGGQDINLEENVLTIFLVITMAFTYRVNCNILVCVYDCHTLKIVKSARMKKFEICHFTCFN